MIATRLSSTKPSWLSSGLMKKHRFLKTLIMAFAFHLCVPVVRAQEASSVKGFSLAMSSEEIEFVARTRFGLQIVHAGGSLDLYRPGDNPDRTRPIAYFSYGDVGKITCMHFSVHFFSGQNTLLKDVLRTIRSAYEVKEFLEQKLTGHPVRYYGYTKFGEYVSVHSEGRRATWVNFCSTRPR